jgi:PA domain
LDLKGCKTGGTATRRVKIPDRISFSLETHVSLAAFGSNPWGRTIFASIELANPLDACNYIKEDDSEFKKVHIMVAKRGSCKFVQKAHYAQLAGAEMLIIVDNIDEDVDTRLMIDDGVLGNLHKLF